MQYFSSLVLFFLSFSISAQTDAEVMKSVYSMSLSNGKSYEWLDYLSNQIGGRLSGSHNAELAVEYTKEQLEEIGLDKVWLQPVMVPHWVRGEKEIANYTANGVQKDVPICALGFSVATPKAGVLAEVIEVKSLAEAEALGNKMKGKIVFFNFLGTPFMSKPFNR